MTVKSSRLPKVQIIHRSLLISHVNIEGEKVYWRKCPPAQNLKQRRQSISHHIRLRRRRRRRAVMTSHVVVIVRNFFDVARD